MDAEKTIELYERMRAEQNEFRSWLEEQPTEDILSHAAEYAIREDILTLLENNDLDTAQAEALLASPTPLADLYKKWGEIGINNFDNIWYCIEERTNDRTNTDISDVFDACKRCGTKHFIGTDGLCSDCRGDNIALADIENGKTKFVGEDEVRCPWCGKRVQHEVGLDDDILFDGGIETCPHCGRVYNVFANPHWTYDTRRVETSVRASPCSECCSTADFKSSSASPCEAP